jgi:hypothetical protein
MPGILFGSFIVWVAFVGALVTGWIMNIVSLIHMTDPLSSGVGVLRIVGIFLAPLGSIMGLFV